MHGSSAPLELDVVRPAGLAGEPPAPEAAALRSPARGGWSGWPWGPGAVLALLLAAAALGPWIVPHDPIEMNLAVSLRPPAGWAEASPGHWLGTDNLGRDLLSRIIAGARISVLVAFYAIALSGTVGAAVGMVSGYFGGLVDSLIMRLVDIQLSIPSLALALVLATVLEPGFDTVVIVVVVTYWTWYARIVRGEILSLRERDFVALAVVAGCSTATIFRRHFLPNIANTLLVLASLQVGQVILYEAALSFLGLGIQTPDVSWGLMLSDARPYIATAWWTITLPGLAIMATCLASNLLGDWLRDALDPARRQG